MIGHGIILRVGNQSDDLLFVLLDKAIEGTIPCADFPVPLENRHFLAPDAFRFASEINPAEHAVASPGQLHTRLSVHGLLYVLEQIEMVKARSDQFASQSLA